MKRISTSSLIVSLALLFVAGAGTAHADKLTIIVGGMDKQIYLPGVLTERLGYFKEQGLDVDLINTRAGVDAENELIAGGAQGVIGFYDHTVDLQSKGKAIISIVQFSQAPGEVELVSSKLADKVKSPADFKGQTLGVTGLGSSTDFLTQYLAIRAGLKPGEFSTLAVGAGNTFIAAMKQNQIAAGMTTEPTIQQMLKTGDAKLLVDMRTPDSTKAALGGTYPAASFYVSAAWLAKNPDTAQKLANAFVKTLKYIDTHTAAEIADQMPADFYVGDKPLYVKGLDEGKAMFTTDGHMPDGGPDTVLKVQQAFNKSVQAKQIDLSKTYTPQYVDAALKLISAAK